MIIIDSKVKLTVDVISKVAQGKLSMINAAKLLNKQRRSTLSATFNGISKAVSSLLPTGTPG